MQTPISRREWGLLFGVVLLFIGWRTFVAAHTFIPNFDTGTVGLMGLNILEGDRPLFFYGQHYMGALEGYLAAWLFLIFGKSSTVLALSPILFSAGWLTTTWMLFRELTGRRAPAWAALMLVAFPNWLTVWYSLASYGGYPGCYFFGTLCWWAAVRLFRPGCSARTTRALVLLVGFSAGLALWTNFQSAVYLLMAGGWMAGWLFSESHLRRHGPILLLAGVLFLLAVSPVLRDGGDAQLEVPGHSSSLLKNLGVLFHTSFSRLFFEPAVFPEPVYWGMLALVLFGLGGFFYSSRSRSWRAWNPLLFWGAYSALYIVHPMASMGAARYLIPGWTALCIAAFAMPLWIGRGRTRSFVTGALTLFVLATGISEILNIRERTPRVREARQLQQQIVADALQAGLRSVDLVGDPLYGHRGQAYTFTATNAVQFVSVYDERIQSRALAAEREPAYGMMYPGEAWKRMKLAFLDLDAEVVRIQRPGYNLAAGFALRHRVYSSVYPDSALATRSAGTTNAQDLLDRKIDTFLTFSPATQDFVELTFASPVHLGMLWFTAPGPYQYGLPAGYRIEGSLDGSSFFPVYENPDRIPDVYRLGNRMYAKGFQARMEIRFPAREVSTLRITMTRASSDEGEEVALNEIMVFADEGPRVMDPDADARAVVAWASGHSFDLVVADRHVSARLQKEGIPVFERLNPKFASSMRSRVFELQAGTGLLVDRALRGEVERLLKEEAPEGSWEAMSLGSYTGFRFLSGKSGIRWLWNGHFPMHAPQDEPPWR